MIAKGQVHGPLNITARPSNADTMNVPAQTPIINSIRQTTSESK